MHPNAHVATDLRLARAFLALTDDGVHERVRRSLGKVAAAAAAVLVLALAAPLMWMSPAPAIPSKAGDQPAATLANSKAVPAALDDEDDGAD